MKKIYFYKLNQVLIIIYKLYKLKYNFIIYELKIYMFKEFNFF